MNKLNQKGVAHLFILVILVLGLFAVLYLVSNRTNWLPKASVSGPVGSTTTFQLSPNSNMIGIGATVAVKLNVRADVSPVNLLNAKISFSKELLSIDRIDYTNSIVKNWVEQFSDNATGMISLVGGIPNPGFQTTEGSAYSPYAVIYFKSINAGKATVAISDGSAIYANIDNIDILTGKDSIALDITQTTPTPAPSSSSTPVGKADLVVSTSATIGIGSSSTMPVKVTSVVKNTGTATAGTSVLLVSVSPNASGGNSWRLGVNSLAPGQSQELPLTALLGAGYTYKFTAIGDADSQISEMNENNNQATVSVTIPAVSPAPSATPVAGTGDGNRDGKVNLIDLSVLLTDYNKNQGFRTGIDMNGDRVINAFDFGLLRNLLIQKGVIKG